FYCFSSFDKDKIETVQNKLCEKMEYEIYNRSRCSWSTIFDATDEVVQLCEGGLFIYSTDSGDTISYIQSEGVCSKSIYLGDFRCALEEINVTKN
ncbi:MAG: hypothetical protein KAQ83_04645, partial [Nanoarchaeota archaeon]|nr:hypothetical protein [Nanoarchaeota archaeon]